MFITFRKESKAGKDQSWRRKKVKYTLVKWEIKSVESERQKKIEKNRIPNLTYTMVFLK